MQGFVPIILFTVHQEDGLFAALEPSAPPGVDGVKGRRLGRQPAVGGIIHPQGPGKQAAQAGAARVLQIAHRQDNGAAGDRPVQRL